MHPFTYTRPADTREAPDAARRGGRYIAGGTTLVDLMRETVQHPETLVGIAGLPLREVTVTERGGLRIGALVRMGEAAAHPKVRTLYPVVSEALELSASAQPRNMATIGGNIMQRTRCAYFRDVTADCNKREPGSGCAALHGHNRGRAILGTSDAGVATHPSDVAVAFAALEASVHLLGPDVERRIPFADFLLKPGNTPHREQAVRQGELITAVEIPALPRPLKSGYLKVRDRQSYEFALTSAAVALHVRGGLDVVVQRIDPTAQPSLTAALADVVEDRPAAVAQVVDGPEELLGRTLYVDAAGAVHDGPPAAEARQEAGAQAWALLRAGRTARTEIGGDADTCPQRLSLLIHQLASEGTRAFRSRP